MWVHDAYEWMKATATLIEQWLDSNGSRPLEQVIGAVWDGAGAQGPFLSKAMLQVGI